LFLALFPFSRFKYHAHISSIIRTKRNMWQKSW
jgi:hypothetical protein